MQLTLGFLSLIALVSAAPADLAARAATTCGSTSYSAGAVDAASSAACTYVQNGGTAGSSTYPHRYNNYEGFEFKGLSGPFYEFPILKSGKVYGGGAYRRRHISVSKSNTSQALPAPTASSSPRAASRPAKLRTPVPAATTLSGARARTRLERCEGDYDLSGMD